MGDIEKGDAPAAEGGDFKTPPRVEDGDSIDAGDNVDVILPEGQVDP